MKTSMAFQIWTKNGKKWKEIENDWVKGHLIVPEQLINIVCRQNVEWDVEQDRDDDDCG